MSARPKMPAIHRLMFTCAFVLLVAAGCKGVTPIAQVLDDPLKYKEDKVRIAGKVTQSVGVLTTGIYEVTDETGKLAVVAREAGVPREGATVGVEGTMRVGFTFGNQTMTVLMEERRYTP